MAESNETSEKGVSAMPEDKKEDIETKSSVCEDNKDDKPLTTPVVPTMPSGPKTRYEWYQTETHVVISVLVKNVKQEDVKVDMQDHSLSCTIRLPGGSDYSLELDLAHAISPQLSQIKILSTRVEIKLKKYEGLRWDKLESDGRPEENIKHFNPGGSSTASARAYPSSHSKGVDWDKIEHDIKEAEKDEKEEGDAALNKLFQQIYGDGSDETRRAMNKSFMESGGTVLSTNWKEVGEKPVDVKPPDGMEYKKYEF